MLYFPNFHPQKWFPNDVSPSHKMVTLSKNSKFHQ
jgi:hypothetical protein